MRAEILGLGMVLLLVMSGCSAPPGFAAADPSKPIHTRDSRDAGTSSEMGYSSLVTNNTTKLHFARGGYMQRWAPDAREPKKDPLYTLPNAGTGAGVYITSSAYYFRHVATNNGTITQAKGQFWFEVREVTPAANTFFFTYTSCNFGMAMSVETPRAPGGPYQPYRTYYFCPPNYGLNGFVPTVLTPGVYSVNLTAELGNGIAVKTGDVFTLRPATTGLTNQQRASIYFWYGARTHDSVIHFEGWEEPTKKEDP